jgi:hypothetical protein
MSGRVGASAISGAAAGSPLARGEAEAPAPTFDPIALPLLPGLLPRVPG